MLNRASERASAAFDKVKAFIADVGSESKCCQIACDLQDFASVRAAAEKICAQFPAGIDVLCNNAGISGFPDKATKDGYGATASAASLLCTIVCVCVCVCVCV